MSNKGPRIPSRPGLYKWIGGTGGYWTPGGTYTYDGTHMEVDNGVPVVSSAKSGSWLYMGPLEKEGQQGLVVYICDGCTFGTPCYLVNEEHTGGGPPRICAYALDGANANWRVNGTT